MEENSRNKAGFLAIPSTVTKGFNLLTTRVFGYDSRFNALEKPGIPFSEIWKVYEQVPWIRAVIDSLSKDASKISYNILEKEKARIGAGKQIDTLINFFEDPNEGEETFGDIIAMAINDALLFDGHGIEVVIAKDKTPVELINVSAKTLKPFYDKQRRRVTGWYHELPELNIKVFFKVGKQYPSSEYSVGYNAKISEHPFTYLRMNPWAHRLGYGHSPAETLTNEIAIEAAQGTSNANYFINRARPDGYIKGLPDRESAKEFQEYWKTYYSGAGNAGNTLILYGEGVDYAQYVEQRKEWDIELKKWTLKTICAVYGINDAELGGEKTENRATAETRHQIAQNRCLGFLLSRIQQRMNKLIVPLFFEDPQVEFHFESIDNQDLQLLVQIYAILLDKGVVTVNEVRNILNLGDDLPWGNEPFDLRSLILSGMWPASTQAEKSIKFIQKNISEISENEARFIEETPYHELVTQGEKLLLQTFNFAFSHAIKEIRNELSKLRKNVSLLTILWSILMIAFQTSSEILQSQVLRTFFKGFLAQKYALPPISFDLASREAIEFIRDYSTPFMLNFCEETRRDIIDVVQQGILKESSTANIVRELETLIDSSIPYLKMVARTESRRAFLSGALKRYERYTNRVRVLDGNGCQECVKANGQIWTIEEAKANLLQHPNCLRDFVPYFEKEDRT